MEKMLINYKMYNVMERKTTSLERWFL